jgi:hypothetical protein
MAFAQERVTATPDPSLQVLVPELHNARVASTDDIREDFRRTFTSENNLGFRFEGDFDSFDQDFMIGRHYDTGLVVFSCTHCDFGHRIVWTGSDFVLQPTPTDFGVPTQ